MKIDFDIALLSCGPFAINLAPMFKRAGKSAIQYGGALQMLFGIKGARWENSDYKEFFEGNDAWIQVPLQEMNLSIEAVQKLDNGSCYW